MAQWRNGATSELAAFTAPPPQTSSPTHKLPTSAAFFCFLTGRFGCVTGFAPPALPAGVVPVNTGALNRVFAFVQTIKDSGSFTDAIGRDLGVIGSAQTGPDLTTIAPQFTVTRTATGVNANWGWGGNSAYLDMIELQVDRGDGKGWVPLAFDTTPGYIDTAAQPATLTKWKYRGIYRVGDRQVGVWSAEVSVTVGG